MSPEELRLEVLKLCYRHDRTEDEIAARACKLSNFVLSSGPSVDSKTPTGSAKKPQADKAKAPA